MSWTERREELLQEACTLVAERVAKGKGMFIGAAIGHVAKTFTNADLGAGRRLKLSPKSLRRHYDNWKRTKEASVFAFKYKASERAKTDPLLLRLVVDYCLQTGESLSEAVETLRRKGARISIRDLYRVSAGALQSFARSDKRLKKQRREHEKKFLESLERVNGAFLKAQRALQRQLLKEDLRLQRRLLGQRDLLQRKFLKADARAVRQRERLQRKFLNREFGRL
jgi:hypothetical protein